MEAGSSSDDEDSIPLSQLLAFPNNKSRTPKNLKKNDAVSAKQSPHARSPAQIATIINKSTALVSPFGTNKTHPLKLSQICEFEENYAQIVKRVDDDLSDEIDAALEEVSMKAALGLMCFCRKSLNGEGIGFGGGKFEPKEMLGFVRDMAVCAWVDVGETVRAVRLSAQVNGYRHYVSVCGTSGVDEEFRGEKLLGFLKNVAVSWGSDEWEEGNVGSEVGQICAYRRFVSLRPDWMFRQSLDVEDGSDGEEGEGSQQDIFDPSLVGEVASGVTGELEDDGFSTEIPVHYCQEQMQESRVICVTNRADFSILDLDEEYESVTSDLFEPDGAGEDNYSNENLQIDDLCVDSISQESDSDVEMACTWGFSQLTDTNQINENGTEFLVNKESTDSSQCYYANLTLESTASLSGDPFQSAATSVPLDRVSDITHENDKLKEVHITTVVERVIPVPSADYSLESTPCSEEKFPYDETPEFQSCGKNSIINIHHGSRTGVVDIISSSPQTEASAETVVKKKRCEQSICAVIDDDMINNSAISVSSEDSNFPESAPCLGGELPGDLASESQTPSPDTVLKFDVNLQSFTEDASVSKGNDADQSETLNTNLQRKGDGISQAEAAEESVAKKRRWVQILASDKTNLQDTMTASSRKNPKIEYSTCMRKHLRSASDKVLSHIKDIAARRKSDGPRHKLHSGSKDSEACHSYTSSKPTACKDSSHQSKKHYQHMAPELRRLYACPLTRDESKSPSKARKSSIDNKFSSSFPRSLHMKFPRDFTLPSKEELEKIFVMFGPLLHSRTKVFTYTGAAQVVFLHSASAYAALQYVKKRKVFGEANVRFWIDQHENYRKGTQAKPAIASLNLRSCLKRPERDKEKRKVRFLLEHGPVSVCTKLGS